MKNHKVKSLMGGFTLSILFLFPGYGGAWWDSPPAYYDNGTADYDEIISIIRGSLGCRLGEPMTICESKVTGKRERIYSENLRRRNEQQFGNFERSIFDIGRRIDEWAQQPQPVPRGQKSPNGSAFNSLSGSSNVENYNCNTGNARTGDAVNDFAHGIFEDIGRWERQQNGTSSAQDKAIDEHCTEWAKKIAPLIDAQLEGAKIKADIEKRTLEQKKWDELREDHKTWKGGRKFVY